MRPFELEPTPNPHLDTCLGCEHLKAGTRGHWCGAVPRGLEKQGPSVDVRGPVPCWCPKKKETEDAE